VTYVLIAINVVTYLGELVRPGIVDRFSNLGDGLMASGRDLYLPVGGAVPGFEQVGIAHGEWYRLITSAFLHQRPDGGSFGILHIVLNMWWLWRLGREAEEMLGRVRFLALYLLAATGGSVLGYLVAPYEGAVGASGAIFGLAAAYYVFNRKLGHPMGEANRIIVLYLIWMVVSAGFSSWEGHLGGLLAGGVIAAGFAYAPARHRTIVQACTAAAMLILLVALVALKSMELTSGTPLAEPLLNGIAHIR
jgi:membrane associated rhomboid family serine protease